MVAAFLSRHSQSINDVIQVYGEMVKLYDSRKTSTSSYPIICMDEANVLMQWQHGSLEKREALRALLRFFVKVYMPWHLYTLRSICNHHDAFFENAYTSQ